MTDELVRIAEGAEAGRRAAWAKFYAAEAETAEVRRQMDRLIRALYHVHRARDDVRIVVDA